MASSSGNDTTVLLRRVSDGDRGAIDDLMPRVYAELHEMASGQLRAERPGHTLDATGLIHEAYMRIVDQSRANFNDRTHFRAIAATMMRRILVDHARARAAAKRGGDWKRLTISGLEVTPGGETDVLALEGALERLAELSSRQADVVTMRYFAGLTIEETAEAIGVSTGTVKGDWRVAQAWLRRELEEDVPGAATDGG